MRGEPLRLMIFDRTCTGRRLRPDLAHAAAGSSTAGGIAARPRRERPLSFAWWSGGLVYKSLLGRLHAWHGARSWAEALRWVATVQPDRQIAEVQFWGHGKWGQAFVDREPLDRGALVAGHALHRDLEAIRERLVGPAALWWFRTCETFGALPGHDWARRLTDFLGCRAAGHTYIIGGWQSGLHSLAPGQTPTWSPHEGLKAGAIEDPKAAHWSKRSEPNTIHFLNGRIPEGF